MKVRVLRVHNYRSFQDASFYLADYGLLIGANNSGKSNAIDLLRTFYEKDIKFDFARDFPKFQTTDDESWIELEYELTPDEATQLRADYLFEGQRFRVRRVLFSKDKSRLHLYGYEGGSLSENQFYGDDNVGRGKLGGVLYIPAVVRLEDTLKFSGPGPLRDLVTDIIKKLVKASSAFETLQGAITTFGAAIQAESTPDQRSLAGLQADINARLAGWRTQFRLRFNELSEADVVKSILDCGVFDEALEKELSAGGCGHGFQRHLIYTLLAVAADYAPARTSAKKKEFAPDFTLLLFEEPENFLHPPQQASLDRSLRNLAMKPGQQVLIATHSPEFVSHNTGDLSAIVRLSRVGPQSIVGQVRPEQIAPLFSENQEVNELASGLPKYEAGPDELKAEMEGVKYFLWLNPFRCGVFFAKRALLVEGPSEVTLINYLIQKGHVPVPEGGVFVLDCLGKFNIHRFMHLLREMRIEHSVLHDADKGKVGPDDQAFHREVNDLIQRSRSELTADIHAFDKDLEDFLECELQGPDHRKPAQLLLALQEQRIAEDRVSEFFSLIARLLGAPVT